VNVLIVEDGTEYLDTLARFLRDGFEWTRAGSGPEALAALAARSFDAVFLDMRFDRCPPELLLGSLPEAAERHDGDPERGRRFLEDHQGTYVLAAVREHGFRIPVLLSYDFAEEPRRWARIAARQGPVAWIGGNAGPSEIASRLRTLAAG
jgi:CheY-like chemotaxis protein